MHFARNLIAGAAVALATLASNGQALAQAYPARPVKILVPYPAGGPADVLVRGLGQRLSEAWGQPVLVDNRPGANEMIAAEAVAKSPSDGYTLLVASDSVFTLNPHLYTKVPYDTVRDFLPVSRLVTANLMLVTRPDFPAANMRDLVDYVKKNPGKLTYASVGAGGVNHLPMAWLSNQNGLTMEHIPYKGLPPALQDVVSGRVDMMVAVIGGAMPFVNDARLKAIAVAGKSRAVIAPNVPTFAEAGFANFDASFYFGVAAPRGTPPEIAAKIASDAAKIVATPDFRAKFLTNLGFEPVTESPEQFANFLKGDRELAAQKVKVSGAKLD
jgi:tripartite-type tricarboxylate transporter receptor subunit TctC